MKKFLSIILAMMVLVLAMSVPAFAATNDGTITIKNATIGKDYKIYKIFDAAKTNDGSGFSVKRVLKALIASVPFMTYIVMITLNLVGLRLPAPVISLADTIRGANTFMAMLMLGVGFKLEANKTQVMQIIKIVLIRYSVAAGLACVFYFLLPFDLEIRQTLVLLAFSPIGAAAPAFTAEMKGDFGLSSAINSICILCSIVFMTLLMLILL